MAAATSDTATAAAAAPLIDASEAERNVEMWKIKRLIKGLEAARGYDAGPGVPLASRP
jgi:hypothetical protein